MTFNDATKIARKLSRILKDLAFIRNQIDDPQTKTKLTEALESVGVACPYVTCIVLDRMGKD